MKIVWGMKISLFFYNPQQFNIRKKLSQKKKSFIELNLLNGFVLCLLIFIHHNNGKYEMRRGGWKAEAEHRIHGEVHLKENFRFLLKYPKQKNHKRILSRLVLCWLSYVLWASRSIEKRWIIKEKPINNQNRDLYRRKKNTFIASIQTCWINRVNWNVYDVDVECLKDLETTHTSWRWEDVCWRWLVAKCEFSWRRHCFDNVE